MVANPAPEAFRERWCIPAFENRRIYTESGTFVCECRDTLTAAFILGLTMAAPAARPSMPETAMTDKTARDALIAYFSSDDLKAGGLTCRCQHCAELKADQILEKALAGFTLCDTATHAVVPTSAKFVHLSDIPRCHACGCEAVDHRGLLTCECPSPPEIEMARHTAQRIIHSDALHFDLLTVDDIERLALQFQQLDRAMVAAAERSPDWDAQS